MSKQNFNVPTHALMFDAGKETASEVEDKLSMTAYSGGLIKDHWYWGDLAIDLSGMSFLKSSYPILENHNRDRKIGFATKDQISINGNLKIEGATFVDTPYSREFRKLSKEKFPYQASIFARPTDIVRLAEGEKTQVNGHIVKGPATVWKRSEYFEASITCFGWDSRTKSAVSGFSADSHLTLSLNVEGDLQDLEDERVANSLFALSSGSMENNVNDDEISDEDEQLAEGLFNLAMGGGAA